MGLYALEYINKARRVGRNAVSNIVARRGPLPCSSLHGRHPPSALTQFPSLFIDRSPLYRYTFQDDNSRFFVLRLHVWG